MNPDFFPFHFTAIFAVNVDCPNFAYHKTGIQIKNVYIVLPTKQSILHVRPLYTSVSVLYCFQLPFMKWLKTQMRDYVKVNTILLNPVRKQLICLYIRFQNYKNKGT